MGRNTMNGFIFVVTTLGVLGCSAKNTKEIGPEITRVDLENGSNSTSDDRVQPHIDSDKGAPYSIKVKVRVEPGEKTEGTNRTVTPAKTLTATFVIPGVPISDSPFDVKDLSGDIREFTRTKPIALPISAKGKTMKVHAEAVDEQGLQSNRIDFDVLLN